MLSLRKSIVRRSWLLPVLGFLLLVLNQQAIACEIMIMPPVKTGQHCYLHHCAPQKPDQMQKTCCDFSLEFSTAGNQCHNNQATVITPSLSGKLSLDFQPVFMMVSLQNVFPYSLLPTPAHIPAGKLSLPGSQTYLATQRLRI